jgi:ribonuclease P protein component
MSLRTGRFQQTDRLRRSVEFQQVIRRGRRAAGAAFVVVVAQRSSASSPQLGSRLGVTVSRKVGGAVVRNRVKRRIREWFRIRREALGAGLDWVVIGRSPAATLGREAAEAELSRLSHTAVEAGA